MKLTLKELIKSIFPLDKNKNDNIENIKVFFNEENFKQIKKLIRINRVNISYKTLETDPDFLSFSNYPLLTLNKENEEDKEIIDFIEKSNEKIKARVQTETFKRFSLGAQKKIVDLIAPNIRGMEDIKLACAIQLFSNEKAHILLLGDPGTGKTDIIRSASELHPKSSFGLGSGTSGAGLGVTYKGNEMVKGLLPLADEGLCCIDELNLMKQEDRASLYNAMEKGFITYDKSNKHIKIDARVSILATANPKGDKFSGWIVETLKKQIPFDSALLTRFHLIFLIRKPEIKEFLEITKHILEGKKKKEVEANKNFVREYVKYAKDLEVSIPHSFEKNITKFIEGLKEKEDKYLIEISPRLVVGFIRFAKASARMDLRKYVTAIDLERVKNIFVNSLEVRKK